MMWSSGKKQLLVIFILAKKVFLSSKLKNDFLTTSSKKGKNWRKKGRKWNWKKISIKIMRDEMRREKNIWIWNISKYKWKKFWERSGIINFLSKLIFLSRQSAKNLIWELKKVVGRKWRLKLKQTMFVGFGTSKHRGGVCGLHPHDPGSSLNKVNYFPESFNVRDLDLRFSTVAHRKPVWAKLCSTNFAILMKCLSFNKPFILGTLFRFQSIDFNAFSS